MRKPSYPASPSDNLSVSPDSGILAVLVRDGERRTVYVGGVNLTTALRAVIAQCDREGWRVAVLSNPVTIFRDMQGTREQVQGAQHGLLTPERVLLGRERRTDLLAPEAALGVRGRSGRPTSATHGGHE